MKKKITVTIVGRPYSFVITEDEGNVEQVAAQVDQMMTSVMKQARVSAMDAAVLTAVNALDSALKAKEAEDSLRSQIQSEVENANKLRQELADARREITRLKKNSKKA